MKSSSVAPLILSMLLLSACQALTAGDAQPTLDRAATAYMLEAVALETAAADDRSLADATVAAAGTRIADLSLVNAALGATLHAAYTPTPPLRFAVVRPEDMGSSLDGNFADDTPASSTLRLQSLTTSRGVNRADGCASGIATQFPASARIVYLVARIVDLPAGVYFEADWTYEGRVLSRISWRAESAADHLCVWFYVTPEDFPFLPGSYSAEFFADGASLGVAAFEIAP